VKAAPDGRRGSIAFRFARLNQGLPLRAASTYQTASNYRPEYLRV